MFAATPGAPSTWYHVLLALHLLCIVGGFGFLAFSGVFFASVRRRGDVAAAAAVEANRSLSQLAELLVVAAFVFGIAAVGASHTIKFSQAWVGGVMAAWVVDMGILHGFIHRNQRRYGAVVASVNAQASTAPAGGPPAEVAQLERLERAMSAGWGVFNLVVVAAIVLTVFQPH